MPPVAVALVLTAAVAHAGWNLAAKFVRGSGSVFVWLYSVAGAAWCVPLMVITGLAGHDRPQWTWLWAALVSAVLHVAYSVVLQRGYAVGDLSVVYPLARGTGPLLSVAFAVLLLGERPGVWGLVGAALVVGGVLVISVGGAATARRRGVSVGYGVATGAAIAAYTLWDAHAMSDIGVPPTVYFGLTVLGEAILLAPVAARDQPAVADLWRRHRVQVVLVGVLSPAAYLLVLYAMRIAPVSLVAPARESSIVLGAIAAWLILKEPHPVRRIVGSVIALSGIAAIALG